MANRKYDYSDELPQSVKAASETSKTSETEKATAASAEEMRRQRLEQRNDALANEFHKLKPEIANTHKQLESLIKKLGAFTETMINLHDLLKTSFPVRFAENDRQALIKEVHAIANDAITQIRNEREKANKDIHRNDNRISMTQTTFWCMIALLLILATFFAIVIFANVKLLHLKIMTEIIVVHAGLIVLTLGVVICIFYKSEH